MRWLVCAVRIVSEFVGVFCFSIEINWLNLIFDLAGLFYLALIGFCYSTFCVVIVTR